MRMKSEVEKQKVRVFALSLSLSRLLLSDTHFLLLYISSRIRAARADERGSRAARSLASDPRHAARGRLGARIPAEAALRLASDAVSTGPRVLRPLRLCRRLRRARERGREAKVRILFFLFWTAYSDIKKNNNNKNVCHLFGVLVSVPLWRSRDRPQQNRISQAVSGERSKASRGRE